MIAYTGSHWKLQAVMSLIRDMTNSLYESWTVDKFPQYMEGKFESATSR